MKGLTEAVVIKPNYELKKYVLLRGRVCKLWKIIWSYYPTNASGYQTSNSAEICG
jgi:hypothetical protein